eukprot:COSAG01_NODE_4114_length_5336_cov_23.503055_1_plen_99_part_00
MAIPESQLLQDLRAELEQSRHELEGGPPRATQSTHTDTDATLQADSHLPTVQGGAATGARGLTDLIKECWEQEAAQRPSFEHIMLKLAEGETGLAGSE